MVAKTGVIIAARSQVHASIDLGWTTDTSCCLLPVPKEARNKRHIIMRLQFKTLQQKQFSLDASLTDTVSGTCRMVNPEGGREEGARSYSSRPRQTRLVREINVGLF